MKDAGFFSKGGGTICKVPGNDAEALKSDLMGMLEKRRWHQREQPGYISVGSQSLRRDSAARIDEYASCLNPICSFEETEESVSGE